MLTNLPVPYDLCISNPISHLTTGIRPFSKCLNRFLNVKALVGALNKEEALEKGLLPDCENFVKVCFQLYYLLHNSPRISSYSSLALTRGRGCGLVTALFDGLNEILYSKSHSLFAGGAK